jgi:hypothetical protein
VDEQLVDIYQQHVAMAFDRRLRLADFREQKAAGEKWKHDTTSATLTAGKITFEAHVLGSRHEQNNSWLWAWWDRNLKLTLTNRALGDAVRTVVHKLGVHQLVAAGFSLEPLLGNELSEHAPEVFGSILCSELGYDAYHLIDKGRTTILVRDDRLKFTEKNPLRRILTVFPKTIKALPVFDHKAAFMSYAQDYGLPVTREPGIVKVKGEKGGELIARFDDHNKLTKLEGENIPEPKPAKPASKPTVKPAKKTAKSPAKKPAKIVAKKPVKVAAKRATKPTKKAKAAAPAKKAGKKR